LHIESANVLKAEALLEEMAGMLPQKYLKLFGKNISNLAYAILLKG